MKCPYCNFEESKVVDSRSTDEGMSIRRRRACISCGKRFTTYEKIENMVFMVIKRDGSREAFNRNKILTGLMKACEKRPVTREQIDAIADNVEKTLSNRMEKEIKSSLIGEIIMDNLKDVDEVAYVRFASVYRQFKDINTFIAEIDNLLKHSHKPVSTNRKGK